MAMEKTEKATPRKRKESRDKGQVAKSPDIVSALIILTGFVMLVLMGQSMGQALLDLFRLDIRHYTLLNLTEESLKAIFAQVFLEGAKILLPIFGVILIMGVGGNLLQVGFLFTSEPIKMKANRLNPIEGLKRIFSLKALAELMKSIIKFVMIVMALTWIIWSERDMMLLLPQWPLLAIVDYIGSLVIKIGVIVGLLLLVLSVFDYMYQRYEHEKSIRMSKQDIKDEMKRSEGDPLIRSRIKEKQRSMAVSRMMQEVPHADVVITNPTHFAVVLRYEMEKMPSPKVVAKGQDYLALRIKEVAREHGVAQVENPPLARLLYSKVDTGDWVPEEMFQAVAEVLAYVYRLKGDKDPSRPGY